MAWGPTASKDYVVDNQVEKDAHVVENGSLLDKSAQPASDQRSSILSMKNNKSKSEDSSMGGWERGSQRAIFLKSSL